MEPTASLNAQWGKISELIGSIQRIKADLDGENANEPELDAVIKDGAVFLEKSIARLQNFGILSKTAKEAYLISVSSIISDGILAPIASLPISNPLTRQAVGYSPKHIQEAASECRSVCKQLSIPISDPSTQVFASPIEALESVQTALESIRTSAARLDSTLGESLETLHARITSALLALNGEAPVTLNSDAPELPETLYTLLQGTLRTILVAAQMPESNWFLCRKFAFTKMVVEKDAETGTVGAVSFELYHGRVAMKGPNGHGQLGDPASPAVTGPVWVRVPPVSSFFTNGLSSFAATSRGVYSWGSNTKGQLGVGSSERLAAPRRAVFPSDFAQVERSSGHHRLHQFITEVMFSTTAKTCPSSFIQTQSGWLAAGCNKNGALGIGSDAQVVSTFQRVHLPADFISVDAVILARASFWLKDGQCYCCGYNQDGSLGNRTKINAHTPAQLTVGAHDIDHFTVYGQSFIFLSDGRCWLTGPDRDGLVNHNNLYTNTWISTRSLRAAGLSPNLLNYDRLHPSKIAIGYEKIFIRLTEQWLAIGENDFGQLGTGECNARLQSWMPVALPLHVDIVDFFDGGDSVWFVTTDGLYAAGSNRYRRLGREGAVTVCPAPVKVEGIPPGIRACIMYSLRHV
ncbi:RCC1 repeat-containing protein [Carpediemonas membranifera]|uniref:RCC1 repeat-containing protein n=1 Tax=Carpediemonas membranifera TaxID=201153 RepID=A0A8J6B3N4_9EUKA|nr:RCC1 repeat-containing protein [Carpediemonas membranifera]|eukprot:KAG9397650.1 RCC1 repeat-containing protein [Carpediemonas membranifera]